MKPKKIEFAPGCFDNFTGTQEDLDELMEKLNQLVESGELFELLEDAEPVTDPELIDMLESRMNKNTRH